MHQSDHDRLHAAVRDEWQATTPAGGFDPQSSWGETGADSLETMTLVLRLERRLGRAIPLDLVTPETTPDSLAESLARPQGRNRDERVPIFLIPGLLGDEPGWADFRRALGPEHRLETLRPPDLTEPVSTLADLRAAGRQIADEAQLRQPEGPLLIAGYSFGANLAYEAASALIAQGRQVIFVGLIDPVPPEDDGPHNHGRPWARRDSMGGRVGRRFDRLRTLLSARGEGVAGYATWLAIVLLTRVGALDSARRIALSDGSAAGSGRSRRRHMHVMRRLRADALRRWRPEPLPAPALLVSGTSFTDYPGFRKWDALLPTRKELRVPIPHLALFKPGSLEPIAARFEAAVREAQAKEG